MGGLPSFSLPGLGLSLIFSVLLCVHVVRTHREMYWLWIILLFQPIGGVVYLIAIVLPEMFRGPTARKVGRAAQDTLDPARAYRQARQDHDLAQTVHNQMRLAAAASELGRHDEAEGLYAQALQGVHADDPALLLGRAKALIELGRPGEAMPLLEQLGQDGKEGRTPQAMLALARAYEGLGRNDEAAATYDWAAPRFPGLEGCRPLTPRSWPRSAGAARPRRRWRTSTSGSNAPIRTSSGRGAPGATWWFRRSAEFHHTGARTC